VIQQTLSAGDPGRKGRPFPGQLRFRSRAMVLAGLSAGWTRPAKRSPTRAWNCRYG